jgi:hypothetical protein
VDTTFRANTGWRVLGYGFVQLKDITSRPGGRRRAPAIDQLRRRI